MKNKTALRMCISCREMKDKRELFRVVRTPDGETVPDSTGKLSGRGAYLCKDAECIKKAQKTKALSRALNAPVEEDLFEALLEEIKG